MINVINIWNIIKFIFDFIKIDVYLPRILGTMKFGGDSKVPSFYTMNKEVVNQLVSVALSENKSLFLLDLTIHQDNKIVVIVDGDQGVPLQECIRISRHIENNIDREVEDYALEVTTPDISDPIINNRQYKKNLQRTLKVTLKDGSKLEGILVSINETGIVIESKVREPKPIGKGKITVIKNFEITFEEIEKAIVKIMF